MLLYEPPLLPHLPVTLHVLTSPKRMARHAHQTHFLFILGHPWNWAAGPPFPAFLALLHGHVTVL